MEPLDLPNDIIHPGSPVGMMFGFTPDLFSGYLWKRGTDIVISLAISRFPGKGNFSTLCKNILGKGFGIIVPTPLGAMEKIVREHGFIEGEAFDDIMGSVEIWSLPQGSEWRRVP